METRAWLIASEDGASVTQTGIVRTGDLTGQLAVPASRAAAAGLPPARVARPQVGAQVAQYGDSRRSAGLRTPAGPRFSTCV
jgi:hypothetical protein